MELENKKALQSIRNAPKGLSSEFHANRSHTDTTLDQKTYEPDGPPESRTGLVNSIAAPLASLAPLR